MTGSKLPHRRFRPFPRASRQLGGGGCEQAVDTASYTLSTYRELAPAQPLGATTTQPLINTAAPSRNQIKDVRTPRLAHTRMSTLR